MLMRSVLACGFFSILVSTTPAAALTATEKMETCKFGADHQKLAGEARKKFLTKCMAEAPAPAPAAAAKTQ
jgi:psiF repeat